MDKKAKRTDRLQNLLIFLLSASALLLALQTPLFGELSANGIPGIFSHFFRETVESGSPDSSTLATAAAPVRIVISNNFVRFGADDLSTADPLFEAPGAFLAEAIGSAQEMHAVPESKFIEQLQLPGLYFDFYSDLPLEVLASRLGVVFPNGQAISARRCLLSLSGTRVTLYVQSTDSCYRFSCAVSAKALAEYLEAQEGNDAEFAVSLGEEYAHLSPYTLFLSELAPRRNLTAANPIADFDNTDLLSCAEFNPHTQDRYSESSGTVVILEGQRILRVRSDGTVVYSGSDAELDSLYRVSAATHASPTEAIAGARELLSVLLQGRLGEASLYLHSAKTTPSGFRLYFDYAIGGTPVRFSDSSHAAEVVVTDNSITAYTVHCRRYQRSESDSLLLPIEQASAVCRDFPGGEPTVAYIDSLGEIVSAGWVAN